MRLLPVVYSALLLPGLALAYSPQTAGCTYSLSPGSQGFSAAGGNGTVTVTTSSGCAWAATSNAAWITFPGPSNGTGSGAFNYVVAANPGDDQKGTITVAGLAFTVEQTSSAIAVFNNVGSMAQLAFGGAWTTTFTLVNLGVAPAQARLNFFDNNGNPLPVALVFPQSSPAAGPLVAATLDRTVSQGAALVIQTAPLTSQPTQVGWTQLYTSGSMSGFAVFQQAIGTNIQEALVPLENRASPAFEVWFDNTGLYATGIGLVNTSQQVTSIPVVIHDDTGLVLLSTTVSLPAQGHISFDLAGTYQVAAGKRGIVEVDTPNGTQISVLGLRFNPAGAFTTIPVLAK